jgi:hypothetical protein
MLVTTVILVLLTRLDVQFVAADVSEQITELRAHTKSLKAEVDGVWDVLGNLTSKECPSDFVFVPEVNGCYKLNPTSYPWDQANAECRKFNEKAHLLIIDNVAEQAAIASAMENRLLQGVTLSCMNAENFGGYQFLTAGQRYVPDSETEFVWKVPSVDQRVIRTQNMNYINWYQGQPDFGAEKESCLSLIRGFQYQWNDRPCALATCSICEVDL